MLTRLRGPFCGRSCDCSVLRLALLNATSCAESFGIMEACISRGKGRKQTRPVCLPGVQLLPGLLAKCASAHGNMTLPSFVMFICACGVSQCHGCGHVKSGSLVEANSHKSFDGFRPQQSGRDGMLRHAALSASLQDTVGRPWHGQTNHVFGLVMFKPLLHPDLGTCWLDSCGQSHEQVQRRSS